MLSCCNGDGARQPPVGPYRWTWVVEAWVTQNDNLVKGKKSGTESAEKQRFAYREHLARRVGKLQATCEEHGIDSEASTDIFLPQAPQ